MNTKESSVIIHTPRGDVNILAPEIVERFWKYVAKAGVNECWMWTGAKIRGYGILRVYGLNIRAHRLSRIIHNGPIPEGILVCHRCDVPGCVNPAHLWLGTDADNSHDRDKKGRGYKQKGEFSGNAKITEADVREIRRLFATGRKPKYIADACHVCQANVYVIIHRRSWAHVP